MTAICMCVSRAPGHFLAHHFFFLEDDNKTKLNKALVISLCIDLFPLNAINFYQSAEKTNLNVRGAECHASRKWGEGEEIFLINALLAAEQWWHVEV